MTEVSNALWQANLECHHVLPDSEVFRKDFPEPLFLIVLDGICNPDISWENSCSRMQRSQNVQSRNVLWSGRLDLKSSNFTSLQVPVVGLAYNHPWMLTTLGCPFLALALCCCGLYYLLGPVGPRIAPIIFVHMALFYLFSKGQHSEHLTCLASLRSQIFSERMPPLGTFCFLRVSLHLSLPTQNWLGLIQGEGDGDQGQERMLLLWRSFRTGDAQIPQVRNSENPRSGTPKIWDGQL